MARRLLTLNLQLTSLNALACRRLLSSASNDDKSLKKVEKTEEKILQKYLRKIRPKDEEEKEEEERKGPFKNYFEDEERNKSAIVFYEEYFDKNTKQKDRDNFMSALEAFRVTNPTKNLYLDFIYGALLKMKEYNAHTHLEAYRKLMEIFPIGPIKCLTKWQRDNMHFPRHQNCAIQILEQMERNGVILDEDFVRLTIKIFGDWTHVVRKAKRQLYWLPKFKNSNPYPIPSIEKLENMKDIEIAFAALERMCMSADNATRIEAYFTDDLEEKTKDNFESTWIVTAQSQKQAELLKDHKKSIPIFVEGPFITWIRSKMVEYFVMKTDPDPEIIEKIKQNENYDDLDQNFKNLHNMFNDPFRDEFSKNKKSDLSVHELTDGTIFALCCTGTGTKTSLFYWTKILEKQISELKDFIIVYKIKPKPSFLVDLDKLKNDFKENQQKSN
ncbi:unnamed protein product [Brachionus calyciflorus]|uniref:Evolutionarily conserved signaling intermediate in Toll pathway, mitochondrial n=1 Tax=Brachionus calyciflorus TaxID=104777 RepID=A0A813M120_9BILA|nr:unnamed protein product [Brachionus calyciflorus]